MYPCYWYIINKSEISFWAARGYFQTSYFLSLIIYIVSLYDLAIECGCVCLVYVCTLGLSYLHCLPVLCIGAFVSLNLSLKCCCAKEET